MPTPSPQNEFMAVFSRLLDSLQSQHVVLVTTMGQLSSLTVENYHRFIVSFIEVFCLCMKCPKCEAQNICGVFICCNIFILVRCLFLVHRSHVLGLGVLGFIRPFFFNLFNDPNWLFASIYGLRAREYKLPCLTT